VWGFWGCLGFLECLGVTVKGLGLRGWVKWLRLRG